MAGRPSEHVEVRPALGQGELQYLLSATLVPRNKFLQLTGAQPSSDPDARSAASRNKYFVRKRKLRIPGRRLHRGAAEAAARHVRAPDPRRRVPEEGCGLGGGGGAYTCKPRRRLSACKRRTRRPVRRSMH